MKVDHMKGAVLFGNTGLESDKLQDHLAVLAESLNKARAMIYPTPKKASKLGEVLPGLGEIVDKEHKRLLARKSIIEKRKEEQERQLLEMEREEESKRQHLLKKTEEAEKKRLAAEKLTKQTLIERALSEQLKERQEQEKRLQKVAKTMDHLERAKREEAAPLIEAAFQRRLVEEKVLHEREQQLEVELSRQRYDGDLKEKNRLARMLENKVKAERRRKEEAEHKAKMDEIAEKQRQRERELEEKERLRREALLGRAPEGISRPSELPAGSHTTEPVVAAPAAAAPTSGKYVPRFRRERPESSGPAPP
ncbi:hypothetical protein Gotri_028070, partial [Gossypium trilobum]|nr:hypothetical protein [Gossypium trilobum]